MLDESLVTTTFYNQLSIQKLDFFLNINHAVTYMSDFLQVKLNLKKEEYRWVIYFVRNHIIYFYILTLIAGG